MRLFNVLTKKTITKDGEPLHLWHRVGLIKSTNSGNWYLQMFHQPDTDFYLVEQEQEKVELPTIEFQT